MVQLRRLHFGKGPTYESIKSEFNHVVQPAKPRDTLVFRNTEITCFERLVKNHVVRTIVLTRVYEPRGALAFVTRGQCFAGPKPSCDVGFERSRRNCLNKPRGLKVLCNTC